MRSSAIPGPPPRYRLLSGDQQVVDIAFEAGYGSHEAFTRAFARAYGQAPSRWRQHPTRTQIEGASGVHFHPPGNLRLPTTREVTPMDLMTRMIEHHVLLTGELLERAARLTDEQLDAPIDMPQPYDASWCSAPMRTSGSPTSTPAIRWSGWQGRLRRRCEARPGCRRRRPRRASALRANRRR